ncbi:hypothetical protein [Subdoligranulum variabile]|uniref:Prophage pi2 protein 38 n=1 Tax=Subdoligranulum variabile DSM 15176 TaxID=411471 RepID=D1PND5_9FIRM|nr:hypothetical protein [Subdoligranulum variabile]EFB76070.1 hypothetical protein SUBVAR_05856 [Subdoligranulum variabile DSM 15176]UWP68719.1 hypothetical protein NQ490_02400 [Subdoligranulum variabile]
MTLEQIAALLETTGLPVVFQQWQEGAAPPMPYLVYLFPYTNNFAADGTTYFVANHVQIELYTQLKDPVSEGKVEAALSSLYWEKDQTYLDTEKCYQTIYEIEV